MKMKILAKCTCPTIARSKAACCRTASRCNTATDTMGLSVSRRSIYRNDSWGRHSCLPGKMADRNVCPTGNWQTGMSAPRDGLIMMPKLLSRRSLLRLLGVSCVLVGVSVLWAQQSFTGTAADVNRKMVKLFGAGGFKGLPSYGTGILVSSKGHILTCNNHILSSTDVRAHLYDGRFYHCKVLFREPELDVAMVQISDEVDFLPHFEIDKAAARPLAEPGDWILALSNCFHVATRDEPMSVQHGVIAAYSELRGRRGVFEAPFTGEVYFVDAIANNPGAAGGVITNRRGELLGMLG